MRKNWANFSLAFDVATTPSCNLKRVSQASWFPPWNEKHPQVNNNFQTFYNHDRISNLCFLPDRKLSNEPQIGFVSGKNASGFLRINANPGWRKREFCQFRLLCKYHVSIIILPLPALLLQRFEFQTRPFRTFLEKSTKARFAVFERLILIAFCWVKKWIPIYLILRKTILASPLLKRYFY